MNILEFKGVGLKDLQINQNLTTKNGKQRKNKVIWLRVHTRRFDCHEVNGRNYGARPRDQDEVTFYQHSYEDAALDGPQSERKKG